jgi:hypothetical protein
VNKHAVVHSGLAPVVGYEACADCHRPGGDAVTGEFSGSQVGLCSQYDFAYPGIPALDPNTDEILTDPVSGMEIISGGKIALYDNGVRLTS